MNRPRSHLIVGPQVAMTARLDSMFDKAFLTLYASLVLQGHLQIVQCPCRHHGHQNISRNGDAYDAKDILGPMATRARYRWLPVFVNRCTHEDAAEGCCEDVQYIDNHHEPQACGYEAIRGVKFEEGYEERDLYKAQDRVVDGVVDVAPLKYFRKLCMGKSATNEPLHLQVTQHSN
jgi:hypothetical protein